MDELIANVILALLLGVFAVMCWLIYLVNMAFQGGGLWWLAIQNPDGQKAFAEILAQHGWTNARFDMNPTTALNEPTQTDPSESNSGGPVYGPVPGQALPAPPADQWALMVLWADGRAGCPFQPTWLAARAWDESRYGTNMKTSSAGAIGYGQFLPSTWAMPGIGLGGDPYDFHDAIPAMARYFCTLGINKDPIKAQLGYNHSQQDADYVASLVASWSTGGPSGWRDHPMLDQYDVRSWASMQIYATWHDAACSAATLWWFASAYGKPLPNLDVAVQDEVPAISPTAGLLNHTGADLAAVYTRTLGMSARNGNLNRAGLIAQLKSGPVALDGKGWFGVGHWFVAVASDDTGLSIRESSGHNFTHITWGQLFGEVGWDGWSVWVTAPTAQGNAA